MLEQRKKKILDRDKEHIAYYSMELGISHTIPTYSGGLGVLAGDLVKSYADIGLPAVIVTMLNEKGYFYQKIDKQGNQVEEPVEWNVSDFMVLLPNEIIINIEGRKVYVRAWKLTIRGQSGFNIPAIFLDTNTDKNSKYDRTLTSYLYGGDRYYRLCQEIVLGIGGTRMLESMGYNNIKKYHMNEGHAALLTVELMNKLKHSRDACDNDESDESSNDHMIDIIRNKCIFTTHTPVAAGHDRFDIDMFSRALGDYFPDFLYEKIKEENKVNMTLLGLVMSRYVNGVAKRHGEITKEMFPEFKIDSITNGIHPRTWVSFQFKKLFDKHIPGWSMDPYTLRYALSIPRKEIWQSHYEAKQTLIDLINQKSNIGFHKDRFTIGIARRFTAYKRPSLILKDVERLKAIANKVGDIQLVFAGKAHKNDTDGKNIIKYIVELSKSLGDSKLKVVFLNNYEMKLARHLVSGCDLWMNTPQRPYEASGTSGMKAALNGVPQFSTLDGWWVEGHIENKTGWSIGAHPQDEDFNNDTDDEKDAEDMYTKLEKIILPIFYNDKKKWTNIMIHSIAINASFFNTYRMAQQYISNAYLE